MVRGWAVAGDTDLILYNIPLLSADSAHSAHRLSCSLTRPSPKRRRKIHRIPSSLAACHPLRNNMRTFAHTTLAAYVIATLSDDLDQQRDTRSSY